MKKSVPAAPVAVTQQGADSAGHGSAAAQLHASPHMVAQRQQLAGAVGTAQLAGKKKLPAQHKADPAVQLKGEKKKPGMK